MNVNLEVVTIPVSDVDKALYFYRPARLACGHGHQPP
jgi:hypothetical protein